MSQDIILYHGSKQIVKSPEILYTPDNELKVLTFSEMTEDIGGSVYIVD